MNTEPTKDDASRLIRLCGMILEIKTNPTQTPEQIYSKLKIGRTQYFEYKKQLEKIGFVYEYNRTKKRHVIKRDITLPILNLSASEIFSLVMAVRQMSAAGDHTITFDALNAIQKIIANSEARMRELLMTALNKLVLKDTFRVESSIIESIRKAQKNCVRIEILYKDFSHNCDRTLQVDPYMIFFKGRALYMDAYVPDEKMVKMFRLNRIKSVIQFVSNFSVRDDYDFSERHMHSYRVMIGNGAPKSVKVKFAPPVARYIEEAHWHESQQFSYEEDGSLILRLKVSDPREVLYYLAMPWGDKAEILEPKWLRDEALSTAQNIVKKYM